MQSSQDLLNKLDKLLSETSKPPPRPHVTVDDATYTVQYELFEKKIQSQRDEVVRQIVDRACEMLGKGPPPVFRICSIGCGDGKLDQHVLTQICERFPNVKIHFCGFDVNDTFVEHAKESLKQFNNVEVEVLVKDIESLGDDDFAPCDLVLCVSVLYYVGSVERALTNMLKLLKNDGVALIFHASSAPVNQLYRRFWFHEHQSPIKFSDDITAELDRMGVRYGTNEIKAPFDLTDCFEENFQLEHQRHILNFLAHTKLDHYSEDIKSTCVDYLASIAIGKPKKYSLVRVAAVIDIVKE